MDKIIINIYNSTSGQNKRKVEESKIKMIWVQSGENNFGKRTYQIKKIPKKVYRCS